MSTTRRTLGTGPQQLPAMPVTATVRPGTAAERAAAQPLPAAESAEPAGQRRLLGPGPDRPA
ncbi:hypothetical protein [Streptomyces sp. NPDC005476]|uniref:hypothetical protein n=1 Tax=Streptomyces sp. NPDC005476 TaxID=3156882 RepID=UPI003455DF77